MLSAPYNRQNNKFMAANLTWYGVVDGGDLLMHHMKNDHQP